MGFVIPPPLRAEHDELHQQLLSATKAGGAVGEAALEVARLLHPHFVREEEFALPALGLLFDVVRGAVRAEMAEVVPLTRRLKAELPAMFSEHRDIVAALARLQTAAALAGMPGVQRLAQSLVRHAEMEELVLYPAAILLGEYVEQALQETAAAA